MELVDQHLKIVTSSGFVKNGFPLSTMFLAHPERAKTTEVQKIKAKGILLFNDLTAYGLLSTIKKMNKRQLGSFHHLIIPDLERINARSQTVRKELMSTLQIAMQEGLQTVKTAYLKLELKKPLVIGCIMATTPEDISPAYSIFKRASFLSRLIPYSYDYDRDTRNVIFDFIKREDIFRGEFNKTTQKSSATVNMETKYKSILEPYGNKLAKSIDDFSSKYRKQKELVGTDEKGEKIYREIWVRSEPQLLGVRATEQLICYLKAVALSQNQYSVSDEHFEIFKTQFEHFNFDRKPL